MGANIPYINFLSPLIDKKMEPQISRLDMFFKIFSPPFRKPESSVITIFTHSRNAFSAHIKPILFEYLIRISSFPFYIISSKLI